MSRKKEGGRNNKHTNTQNQANQIPYKNTQRNKTSKHMKDKTQSKTISTIYSKNGNEQQPTHKNRHKASKTNTQTTTQQQQQQQQQQQEQQHQQQRTARNSNGKTTIATPGHK